MKRLTKQKLIIISLSASLFLGNSAATAAFKTGATTNAHPLTLLETPKGTLAPTYGFIFHGSGKKKVDLWEDFQCANCAKFEAVNKDYLTKILQDPNISISYHILSFIGLESQLAANAAGCAADQSKFLAFHDYLYANPPTAKNSGIWSTDALVSIGAKIGLTSPTFVQCVKSTKYSSWVKIANDSATKNKIAATPTVLVNDVPINRDTDYFDSVALEKAVTNPASINTSMSTNSASPVASASPTPTQLSFSVSSTLGVEPMIGKPVSSPPLGVFWGDKVVGSGAQIKKNEKLVVNYIAKDWSSGSVIQTTWKTGSRQIDMSQVISCWQKGLLGMREGGRRVLICPPDFAYGSQGNSKVAPNATVIFVVDLQKIVTP